MISARRSLKLWGLFVLWAALAFGQGSKKSSSTTGASPAGPSQPASSTTSSSPASSSAAIESQMLAGGGLNHIADAIASDVCTKFPDKADGDVGPTSTVVIFDSASFASLQAYEAFIANASAIVSLYESLLPDDSNDPNIPDKKKLNVLLQTYVSKWNPSTPTRSIGISGTIDPFSDANSVISSIAIASTSETPGSIVFPDSSMAVAVTGSLFSNPDCMKKNLRVAYPPLFGGGSASDFSSADIQTELDIVNEVRGYVTNAVQAANNDWIAKHTPQNGTAPANGDPILTAALSDITTQYDNYIAPYLQMGPNGTSSGIGPVVQGYQLANLLAGKMDAKGRYTHPAYILLATVVSAGGTMRDHKSFWTALGNGDKITFSGGLIVSVVMWQPNANGPVFSKVLRYRSPFSTLKDPSDMNNLADGDSLK